MIAQIVEVGWPTNVRVCLQTCVSVSAHTKALPVLQYTNQSDCAQNQHWLCHMTDLTRSRDLVSYKKIT